MSAEGVMHDWCVLYPKQEVDLRQDVAALGYLAFTTAMAVVLASGHPVASIGHSGVMIGPPLIGGLAHAFSLTAALWVVVLASALLALGASEVG